MIKVIICGGSESTLEASGSVVDICTDLLCCVSGIYAGFKLEDIEIAEAFRHILVSMLFDESSQVWDVEKTADGMVIECCDKELCHE